MIYALQREIIFVESQQSMQAGVENAYYEPRQKGPAQSRLHRISLSCHIYDDYDLSSTYCWFSYVLMNELTRELKAICVEHHKETYSAILP